jgi:hypothetical protein
VCTGSNKSNFPDLAEEHKMLERFTIDVLADEVVSTLLEGEPNARMGYLFFRKGRRDGRRQFSHESVSRLLRTAVAVAGSTLGEEFTERAASMRARIAQLSQSHINDAADGREPVEAVPPAQAESVPEHEALSSGTGSLAMSTAVLTEALSTRRRLREEQLRRDREAAAAARAAAAEQARLELIELQSKLAELGHIYSQRFESMKETGELFWSRYCNGFTQGQARRGSRSSDLKASSERLDCPDPYFLGAYSVSRQAAPTNRSEGA